MIYFIPAWYQKDSWRENEQSWHIRRMHSEFDDTVKQIQLFHRSKAYPFRIMLLGYSPNFRHFLHRQSIYHARYWSCFDAIQEVRREKARLLSFHNLNWPEGIEFVYTPFVIVALQKKEKYAQIEFGEDGNPIRVDLYKGNRVSRSNVYDDRGFLSASTVYENGVAVYQDYLMENGMRKMRHYFSDGHVEINGKCPHYLLDYNGEKQVRTFSKTIYESLEEVILEVLSAYLSLTEEKDLFCAAVQESHSSLLLRALEGRKLILSFFKERCQPDKSEAVKGLMKQASYIVTDSQENLEAIKEKYGETLKNITDISPFDTRMDTNINLQFHVQKILIPVDNMPDEIFDEIICRVGEYLEKNKTVMVCLFTRKADYDRKTVLLEKTRKLLKEAGMKEEWAAEEEKAVRGENRLEEEENTPVRFTVEQCVEELAVSLCLKQQRVIVDLREVPELYLQVMAVSLGIPQIVSAENQFAKHKGNAYVLEDFLELPKALDFYLDGLSNWNDAQIFACELSKKYTTAVLLDKWKEVIESVE